MTIYEEYKEIYKTNIEIDFNTEIKKYHFEDSVHNFTPISHNCVQKCEECTHQCYKSLGRLMRKNLVFYCYGEQEIVKKVKSGFFTDLEKATQYAYKNRLPKRMPEQDGLPSEVLFDLLIQSLVPDAYKLAVRAIFRQNDNNEIKGYDLTYFTNDNGKIALWLGQAKLGSESYCKSGINDDLILKFTQEYMSKQVYFISDKQSGLSDEGVELTNVINELNLINIEKDEKKRAKALIDYILNNGISINIPCLLAYGKKGVYNDLSELELQIKNEVERIKEYFDKHIYIFDGFVPNLMFYVFPIEDLEGLRGEEGFYEGLR